MILIKRCTQCKRVVGWKWARSWKFGITSTICYPCWIAVLIKKHYELKRRIRQLETGESINVSIPR